MMFPSLKVQRDTSSGSKIVRSNTMMATPIDRRGSVEAADLERLLRQPPRQVDCSALKAELDAVEQRGGSERLLKQGRSKYKYAERAQRAARTKELVSQVQELMEVQCVELNCEALGTALSSLVAIKSSNDAERLEQLTSSQKPSVDDISSPSSRTQGIAVTSLDITWSGDATLKAAAVTPVPVRKRRLSEPPPEDLTSLLAEGHQALEVAQRAQAEARAAKQRAVVAEIHRCTQLAPLLLEVGKIEAAIVAGEEMAVDTATVGLARDALVAATRRDEAASRLARLNVAGAEGVAGDGINGGASALEAIQIGSECGVAMTDVEAAHTVLCASERADAPRRAATSLLQCLVSLPTLEIDVKAATEALASAVALSGRQLVNGVDLVSTATVTLEAAKAAQTARDAVGAELVTAATRRGEWAHCSPDEVSRLVAEARRAGVAPRLLEACEAKLVVGKGRVMMPTVDEIKAKAVEDAAARRVAAEARAALTVAALVAARKESASLRDAAEAAQRAATASVSAAVEADAKLATAAAETAGNAATSLTGDEPAEAAEVEEARRHIFLDVAARVEAQAAAGQSSELAWRRADSELAMEAYTLRQAVSRNVANASEAFASLEAAEHTEELAAYASKSAAREAGWAVQEHSAYSATLAKGKVGKAERGNGTKEWDQLAEVGKKKKPRTSLGCCGAPLEDEEEGPTRSASVAVIGVRLDVMEELEGLDGLSWAPLLLPLAPKKAELLLCLTLAGGYSNQLVCDAVAREMSAADPLATTKYVRLLADAATQETTGSPDRRRISGPIVDTWLSQLVGVLLEATPPPASASETVQLAVSALASHAFTRTLLAVLEVHCARTNGAADLVEAAEASWPNLGEAHACVARLLGASMVSPEAFAEFLPLWKLTTSSVAPPTALAGAAAHLSATIFSQSQAPDAISERAVLALVRLFVVQPARLNGFQSLVPAIFTSYLARGTPARAKLCETLLATRTMERSVVERIASDDALVAQPFFWSATGITLFGGSPDLRNEKKLTALLKAALQQQPAILGAFLQSEAAKADGRAVSAPGTASRTGLGMVCRCALAALCAHVSSSAGGLEEHARRPNHAIIEAVAALLERVAHEAGPVYEDVLVGFDAAADTSAALLDVFAATYFRPLLEEALPLLTPKRLPALATRGPTEAGEDEASSPQDTAGRAVPLERAPRENRASEALSAAESGLSPRELRQLRARRSLVSFGHARRFSADEDHLKAEGGQAAAPARRRRWTSPDVRQGSLLSLNSQRLQMLSTGSSLSSSTPWSRGTSGRLDDVTTGARRFTFFDVAGKTVTSAHSAPPARPPHLQRDSEVSSRHSRSSSEGGGGGGGGCAPSAAARILGSPTTRIERRRRWSFGSAEEAMIMGTAATTSSPPSLHRGVVSQSTPSSMRVEEETEEAEVEALQEVTLTKTSQRVGITPFAAEEEEAAEEARRVRGGVTVRAAAQGEAEEAAEEEAAALALALDGTRQRDGRIVMALALLFLARPATLTAFTRLVPHVFHSLLRLGTPARAQLNALLLERAFDASLERLFTLSDDLVTARYFWHAEVLPLCTKRRIQADYRALDGATLSAADGSVTLLLYSRLLALLLKLASAGSAEPAEIARRTKEVLDQFERNADQRRFLLSIFVTLEQRVERRPEDFAGLPLPVLSEVAQNGVATISSVSGDGMALCEQAMTTLLQGYVSSELPSAWSLLFKEATNVGFMVKYMFREDLGLAHDLFEAVAADKALYRKALHGAEAQLLVRRLVAGTREAYGEVGMFDPAKLAQIDFLHQPALLVDLVAASKEEPARQGKPDLQLLSDVTVHWMRTMIERKYPPLTPHHTQALVVMMMSRFFADHLAPDRAAPSAAAPSTGAAGLMARGGSKPKPLALKAFIAQMGTGEGKSIVIAMLAVFMAKLHGLKVHVLENNEGLLERDYAQNLAFFERCGVTCAKDTGNAAALSDPAVQVCYCLKKGIGKMFLRRMLDGSLELGRSVLIVDEVDDLIVNEKPNAHYVKLDVERTPALASCLAALREGGRRPEGVEAGIWHRAEHDWETAAAKVEGEDFRVISGADGKRAALQLNDAGLLPKVPLTSAWLKALNYSLCGAAPQSESHFACVCTPYVFNRYAGIFGLTGSVGGKAELAYLTKTYGAVRFNVPRFLDTCVGTPRKVVTNHGVELCDGAARQVARAVELCARSFRKVPVLLIAASNDELATLHRAVRACKAIPTEEVQRLSEFDADGRSLKAEWQTLIDDATKRLGTAEDHRCRVTVTDRFGGRGHDFRVVDKEANANGGMLVIATSVPDEREWIQWKGRTARQDRPGQYHVVLNTRAKPFEGNKELLKKVRGATIKEGELKGQPDHEQRVELLLSAADEGIGDKLREYAAEQAAGEQLNAVAEAYFKRHPRSFDAPWPSELASDRALRAFFETTHEDEPPAAIKAKAKEQLDIDLDSL